MKTEIREASEQRDAMKAYINGLESALVSLQRKFASEAAKGDVSLLSPRPTNSSSDVKKEENEIVKIKESEVTVSSTVQDKSVDFRVKFMQKAFKSLMVSRDKVTK